MIESAWAKHWYHSLHRSSGFGEYVPKTDPFPESLKPLLTECQPYYEQLSAVAIKA